MEDLTRVRAWIEAGKQVGARVSFEEEGELLYISVAIQKWEGEYKLYFFKTNEARIMDLDYYDAEGVIRVAHVAELSRLLSALSPIKLSELLPQKGQKIFNPAFN